MQAFFEKSLILFLQAEMAGNKKGAVTAPLRGII